MNNVREKVDVRSTDAREIVTPSHFVMTRLRQGGLRALAVFITAACASFTYIRSVTPTSPTHWWVAGGAAGCISVAWWYFMMIFRARRDRRILEDAARGRPPEDGAWGAFIGTIESRESVRAPFSGDNVLAYHYSVDQSKSSGVSEGGATTSTYYSGSASVGSTIVTPAGTFPLLCSPALAFVPENPLRRDEALRNFRAHAAETTFDRSAVLERTVGQPAHRFDRKHWDDEPDWEKASLWEVSVCAGDVVTVFGTYSRAHGGIVADPIAGEEPRIQLGDERESIDILSQDGKHGVSGTLFFLLAAAAILGGYQYYLTP